MTPTDQRGSRRRPKNTCYWNDVLGLMRSWFPATSAPPPRLEATIDRRHLRRLFAPVAAVDGPTELAVADDGLVAASVDDAMVTAVQANLHRTLCDRYDATPGTVGVDATALADVLAAEGADGPATLGCDPDEETLTLEQSAFVHTQAVETDASVELPHVGDPPQGATTYHHGDALADALDYFEDRTEVVALGYDEVTDAFYVEPATTASQTATADTRYRRPRADLPARSTPGRLV
ncbi:uncharacterized protein BN903_83 [Halorubrum sp. AJ67]|nr:uncharacterized protein BN903_83 [Halorubrum sp. AJ67]